MRNLTQIGLHSSLTDVAHLFEKNLVITCDAEKIYFGGGQGMTGRICLIPECRMLI
jgi:hypothetical protein